MILSDKVVLITGGATGIGFAAAGILAERGARVILGQRSAERGQESAHRLQPSRVRSVQLDIRDYAAVHRCIDSLVDEFGKIDVLINNASVTGRAVLAPFISSSPKLVDSVVDTNLKGAVYCSQAVVRHLIEAKRGGSIIHVSSVGGYAAQENASIYCATKAAQMALGRAMAIELAPYGIRVNCVVPGDIETETSAEAVQQVRDSGASCRFMRITPLGRRGSPEEVGRAIAFLASEEASFITGTSLVVDGGFLAY